MDTQAAWAREVSQAIAAAALAALSWPALALDPGNALSSATPSAADLARPQLEVSATALPRFDGGDTRTSRMDMAVFPNAQSNFGLGVGLSNTQGAAPALGPRSSSTNVDLGVHWRYTTEGNTRVGVSAWHRIVPADALTMVEMRDATTYGARVEMQLGSMPKSGFVAEKGFLGVQLEGGARLALKRSMGVPMLYYRNHF